VAQQHDPQHPSRVDPASRLSSDGFAERELAVLADFSFDVFVAVV
jgi:hypothetical protein